MGVPLWAEATQGASVGSASITASDNTVSIVDNELSEGRQVIFDSLADGAVDVIREGAPYFAVNVSGDAFQIAPSAGAPVMEFATDGSAEAYEVAGLYSPDTLRNTFAGLLQRGDHSGAFSARTGLMPYSSESSPLVLDGTAWATRDLVGSVRHSSGETYLVSHAAESGSTAAPDSSFPRIDAVDLKIYVDSGKVESELVYVTGVAEDLPSEPSVTTDAERVETILIPADGTGSPEENTTAKFTTAIGGIVPVVDESQYPGVGGRYKGLTIYDIVRQALRVNTDAGSTWETVASTDGFKLLSAILGWEWDHAAGSVDHSSDTLTALSGGPEVTLDVPDSGMVLVLWGGRVSFDESDPSTLARWRVQMSGINSGTVSDTSTTWSVRQSTGTTSNYQSAHSFHIETGLDAGTTTFTSEYAVSQGTATIGTFDRRSLLVIPLYKPI